VVAKLHEAEIHGQNVIEGSLRWGESHFRPSYSACCNERYERSGYAAKVAIVDKSAKSCMVMIFMNL